MALILDNSETVEYTVVTTYEDDHKAYSVATTDKSVADDYKKRMERGLFGSRAFSKVKSIIVVERTTTVKEKILD
jgi:hypothetical protein